MGEEWKASSEILWSSSHGDFQSWGVPLHGLFRLDSLDERTLQALNFVVIYSAQCVRHMKTNTASEGWGEGTHLLASPDFRFRFLVIVPIQAALWESFIPSGMKKNSSYSNSLRYSPSTRWRLLSLWNQPSTSLIPSCFLRHSQAFSEVTWEKKRFLNDSVYPGIWTACHLFCFKLQNHFIHFIANCQFSNFPHMDHISWTFCCVRAFIF